MVIVEQATSPEAIAEARRLFEEYQVSLGVDLAFQGFAGEVAALPGDYSPPAGRLLLARIDGAVAGCVAIRAFSPGTCEMKRLYIRPEFRAAGAGRALVERAIGDARAIGYERMVLDTLPSMGAAQRLYERLGFVDTEPYRYNPIEGTRFLSLAL